MKILVSGALGLLGDNLLSHLSKAHDVTGLVHREVERSLSRVDYRIVDFSDQWETTDLGSGFDTIIHLAQSSRFRDFPGSALDVFRVNIDSTARLLDYAERTGAKRFIYFSSGGIYGSAANPITENSPISSHNSLGYYLGSKLCGETLCQSYSQRFSTIIMRPFFIYGKNQRKSMLLPRLVDKVKNGESIQLAGQEGIKVNPVHVSDGVRLVQRCLDINKSLTLNMSGPDVLSLREISQIIGEKIGKEPVFEWVDGEPKDIVGDNTLMRNIMKDEPLCSFDEGILDLI